MNKNIVYSFLVILTMFAFSCKKDPVDTVIPFDHEAQIPKDRDSLYVFLDTHYYNPDDDAIWTIGEDGVLPPGLVPLNEDENLDSIVGIEANETVDTYKMYYYITNEGIDNGNAGYSSPSRVDPSYVKYVGMLLDSTVFDSKEDYPTWIVGGVEGWAIGLTKFKRGTFTTLPDNDHQFHNQGTGYIFFPSGLGYRSSLVGGISGTSSSCLIFKVEINDVKLVDTDSDLVPDKFEYSFDAGVNIIELDWDQDGVSDHLDVDDDNDFTTTYDEVMDEFVTEENPLDARGNIDFPYNEAGDKIVKLGTTTDEEPNYKNNSIHLED